MSSGDVLRSPDQLEFMVISLISFGDPHGTTWVPILARFGSLRLFSNIVENGRG